MKRLFFYSLVLLMGCQGKQGDPGPEGRIALINPLPEPAGTNCPFGGLKIETGIDENRNKILDPNEVQNTVYVCNGQNGLNALIKTISEPISTNCANGGTKVEVGTDNNRNNTLDQNEVQSITYICNGNNGKSSLIKSYNEPPSDNCPNGGIKIEIGTDLNFNDILENIEIKEIRFLCNGNNGFFDKQILLTLWNSGTSGAGGTFIRGNLPRFKISNYDQVDSIAYVVKANNTGTVELFNLTDNQSISGSLISINSTDRINYYSKNLVNDFPDKEIDLGIKVSGSPTIWDNVYLVIYRRQ